MAASFAPPVPLALAPTAAAARARLVQLAALAALYVLAAQLAAALPGAGEAPEAEPGPACVGCHHGAEEPAPPPDGVTVTFSRGAMPASHREVRP